MAEVELECAVYGERIVFPVKIARDAKVSALQEAIVEKKKGVNARFNVDPATVTLYLAKKDGAWLKDDRRAKNFLQAGKSAEYEEEMRPSWKLDDDELFGKDFEPGDKEIQVLVELPSHVAISVTDAVVEKAKKCKRLVIKCRCYLPWVIVAIAIVCFYGGKSPAGEKGSLKPWVWVLAGIGGILVLVWMYALIGLTEYYEDRIENPPNEHSSATTTERQPEVPSPPRSPGTPSDLLRQPLLLRNQSRRAQQEDEDSPDDVEALDQIGTINTIMIGKVKEEMDVIDDVQLDKIHRFLKTF